MQKIVKFFIIFISFVFILCMLTACGKKENKETLTFDGEIGKITFQVKEGNNYRISNNQDEFRTSREQGMLIADDFRIGIEFNNNYNYLFDSNLEKLKEDKKNNDDYKVVNYGGVEGVQYFNKSYNRYEVILPDKNNEKYYLNLTIYGIEDKEESAKETINNQDVLDILSSISFEVK